MAMIMTPQCRYRSALVLTTDASSVKLGNLSADRCAQHLQQIAGEEGHIPKHYMMQEVRVAEQLEHIEIDVNFHVIYQRGE